MQAQSRDDYDTGSVFHIDFCGEIEKNLCLTKLIFRLSQLICFIMNPLMVVYWIVLALTWLSFGEINFLALTQRALFASMDALTFSIVDSIVSLPFNENQYEMFFFNNQFNQQIYNNWLFPLVSLIFFPIWITFFGILSNFNQTFHQTKEKLN